MKKRIQLAKNIFIAVLTAASVVSAQAAIHSYTVSFGPEAVGATGTGSGTVNYDDVAHTVSLQGSWSGLSGVTTISHIHLPTTTPFTGTAGVVITPGNLPSFPAGIQSGSYSMTFDMTQASTYPGAYVTLHGSVAGAEAAVFAAFNEGRAYWNIHTETFGGGEIRGFVTPVPEPSTLALAGLGIAAIAARVWSKRRAKIS